METKSHSLGSCSSSVGGHWRRCLLLLVSVLLSLTGTAVGQGQAQTPRTCRRLFRDRPACCLLTTDPQSLEKCLSRTKTGRQCLCHPACSNLGNCCPDFATVCPQPGNRLQAWCPAQYLEELFVDDVAPNPDVHGSTGQIRRDKEHRSLWEKRIARNRFPWHRLEYHIRTAGYRPAAPQEVFENDAEGMPDANRLNFTENGYSLSPVLAQSQSPRPLTASDVPQESADRVRVPGQDRRSWPWSAIGRIVYNHYPLYLDEPIQGTCTGTMIGPRHVLTAAHCLFDRDTRTWHEQISFYPTLTNSTSSFAQRPISWARITVPYAFKVLGLKEYDYGLIVLDSEINNWLAFGAQSPSTQKLELVGFDRFSLWRHDNCTFTPSTESPSPGHGGRGHFPITGHNCSARPGMSGAPLLNAAAEDPVVAPGNEVEARRPSDRVVYAIHTHGTAAPTVRAHHGGRALKINLCTFHTLCGWLNYQDNFRPRATRLQSIFVQSLGESCGAMHDFIPSLIRHSPLAEANQ